MPRRGTLRASDLDREQVAEKLRQAAAEGRLLAEELEQRLASALRARTYAELDPLVADLPGGGLAKASSRRVSPVTTVAVALAAIVVAAVLVALAVVIITGLLAAWAVWAVFAFWFFGRGHGGPRYRRRYSRAHMRFEQRRTLP